MEFRAGRKIPLSQYPWKRRGANAYQTALICQELCRYGFIQFSQVLSADGAILFSFLYIGKEEFREVKNHAQGCR